MRLPFVKDNKFVRLPGNKPACYGLFSTAEMDALLEKKEKKVTGTAARFLQVSETEIIQIIPMSTHIVSVFFAEKEHDLYEYGDEE